MKKTPFSAKFLAAGAVLSAVLSYLVLESMQLDEKLAPYLSAWHRDLESFVRVGHLFLTPVAGLAAAIWCHFKADKWTKPAWLTRRRLILAVVVIFAWNLALSFLIDSGDGRPVFPIEPHMARALMSPFFLAPYVVLLAVGLWWSLNSESAPVSEMERLAVLGMSLGGIGGLILIAIRWT